MIIETSFAQGSDEWLRAKAGIPSASNFDKIVMPSTGKPSKSQGPYSRRLAGEKRLGIAVSDFKSSAAMKRGLELEAEARALLSLPGFKDGIYDNVEVQEVGFCYTDNKKIGCSPDGLIGDDGGLEIKCRDLEKHIKYLLTKKLLPADWCQCQGELYVTGRKWWDFMAYYPGLDPLIVRVYPDTVFITKLHLELIKFCEELQGVIGKLRRD